MQVRTLLRAPLLYALLVALGLVSLGWNLVSAVLYPLLPRARGMAVGRLGVSLVYRSLWAAGRLMGVLRLDASALDGLADEPGIVMAANHPTMLDALLLVARLPKSACIMKADLMNNVFLGAGARLARYIRNDSARGMVRLAVQDLKAGGQLVIFPEGTRTTDGALSPFRPGCTLIAKLAGAPIQTVFIDTDTPYLRKGWPIWRLPPLPIEIRLRRGERFAPSRDADAMQAELERYFQAHVHEARPR